MPTGFPRVGMYTDVGKKQAKCHACLSMIQRGEVRVVFLVSTGFTRYRGGGGTAVRICYCHVGCISALLEGVEPEKFGSRCYECGEKASPNTLVTGRKAREAICSSCAELPKYRTCYVCRMKCLRHLTSPIARPSLTSSEEQRPCCDSCADTDGYYRIKDANRVSRQEEGRQKTYEKIRAKIKARGVLGSWDA